MGERGWQEHPATTMDTAYLGPLEEAISATFLCAKWSNGSGQSSPTLALCVRG